MIDDICDADEEPNEAELDSVKPKSKKCKNNRRRVEDLLEEKRLRKMLAEDDVLQIKSRTYYDDDLFTDFYKKDDC